MSANSKDTKTPWIDPDDAPELTEEFFARAELSVDGRVVRPASGTMKRLGRPPSNAPKVALNLRLDSEVVEHFRATGAGWQSRINAALRAAAGLK